TLACVAGVPAGAALGQALGWRSAFWAVALVCLPAVFAVLRSVPDTARATGGGARPRARRELRALRSPRLPVVLLLAALVNAATFCTFTYVAVLVTGVSGFSEDWVPGMLALFGLGSFAGVTIGGRLSDTRPIWVLVPGGIALLAGWVLLAVTAGSP